MLEELLNIFFIEAIIFTPAMKRVLALLCALIGIALGTLVIYNGNLPYGFVIYAAALTLVLAVYRFTRSISEEALR